MKFLGILLDENLTWKYNIIELHKKLTLTLTLYSIAFITLSFPYSFVMVSLPGV